MPFPAHLGESHPGRAGTGRDGFIFLWFYSRVFSGVRQVLPPAVRDPEKIAAELAKTIDYHGVTGMIALDANHDAIKPVFIMTFWQGQPALLEKRPTVQL